MKRRTFDDELLRRMGNEARVICARGDRVHWTSLVLRFHRSPGTFANGYRARFQELTPDIFWGKDGILQMDPVVHEKLAYVHFLRGQHERTEDSRLLEQIQEVMAGIRELRAEPREPRGQTTLDVGGES